MTDQHTQTPTSPRDWWVSLGIGVSAVSAGFSSFAGLRSLAEATGWGDMAPLFALCIDAYALTAIRVWLAGSTGSRQTRVFAKWNAIGAILLSLVGNATWHLINAHLLPVTWHVVMAVGAVPPVILGLVTHLAVLRRQVDVVTLPKETTTGTTVPQAEGAVLKPPPSTGAHAAKSRPQVRAERGEPQRRQASGATPNRPRYGNDDVLMAAARAADVAHRAAHGKPITRDALRAELRIGGERATAVLRRLRAEGEGQQPLSISQQERS